MTMLEWESLRLQKAFPDDFISLADQSRSAESLPTSTSTSPPSSCPSLTNRPVSRLPPLLIGESETAVKMPRFTALAGAKAFGTQHLLEAVPASLQNT